MLLDIGKVLEYNVIRPYEIFLGRPAGLTLILVTSNGGMMKVVPFKTAKISPDRICARTVSGCTPRISAASRIVYPILIFFLVGMVACFNSNMVFRPFQLG